jgi:hypothetical protein
MGCIGCGLLYEAAPLYGSTLNASRVVDDPLNLARAPYRFTGLLALTPRRQGIFLRRLVYPTPGPASHALFYLYLVRALLVPFPPLHHLSLALFSAFVQLLHLLVALCSAQP